MLLLCRCTDNQYQQDREQNREQQDRGIPHGTASGSVSCFCPVGSDNMLSNVSRHNCILPRLLEPGLHTAERSNTLSDLAGWLRPSAHKLLVMDPLAELQCCRTEQAATAVGIQDEPRETLNAIRHHNGSVFLQKQPKYAAPASETLP